MADAVDRVSLLDTVVVVPGRAAAAVARLMREAIDARPAERQRVPPDVRDTYELLRIAAARWEGLNPRDQHVSHRSEGVVAQGGETAGSLPGQEAERLTTKQAADVLRLSPRRVQQLVEEGQLPGSSGKPIMIDRGAVMAEVQRRGLAS